MKHIATEQEIEACSTKCLDYNAKENVFCQKELNHKGDHEVPLLINNKFTWSNN